MTDQASNNVINNYKGVMLCSRPNEKKQNDIEKPFCPRVTPNDQLGINPSKLPAHHNQRPRQVNPILLKHKKWLAQFKQGINKAQQSAQEKNKAEQQKAKRIKQQAEADRERAKKMKQQYNQAATKVLNILDEKEPIAKNNNNELNTQNLRKLDQENKKIQKNHEFKKKKDSKPVWALTKEQAQNNEEQQVDELLDFFQNNQINQYTQQAEVKQLLVHLKNKIQQMKQKGQIKQHKYKNEQSKEVQKAMQDDKYSNFSIKSQGKSVASQKTQKKIQQLRQKKQQQQQWDKYTTSSKTANDIDGKIVKNIADQVLRNYPNLKGVHSNTSIRRLLQSQAAKAIGQPILRPVITTIVKQKQQLNPQTLPYINRHPGV